MTREPTREEVEAWAAFIEEHPGILDNAQAAAHVARLVAFRARSEALRRRRTLRLARETLRHALTGSDELTADRILAARRAHLDGDRRPEHVIAATSLTTYKRRRRQYGLVPWPDGYEWPSGPLAVAPLPRPRLDA